MKEYYSYDEIFGTLLHKNKDDTERIYFISECEYWSLYKWMYAHGWSKAGRISCVKNGINGFNVILHR